MRLFAVKSQTEATVNQSKLVQSLLVSEFKEKKNARLNVQTVIAGWIQNVAVHEMQQVSQIENG